MAHHSHTHPEDSGTKNISLAFFLNLFFSIIELAGGLLTNSVAILSDAIHDFGDSISLGLAWFLQRKSNQKSDEFYSYGYKRFSLLGAIFISVVLLVSSFFILRESIERIITPQEANARGMFILAILGIAVNGFAAYRLKKGHSMNERAVSLHLLEDVLGWIAVLLASIVMLFVNLPIIDPLLSIAITIWVLYNVYRNLRDTFRVLLQEIPQNIDVNLMLTRIKSLPPVRDIHDFHLWSLDGERNIMTLHVVTVESVTPGNLLQLKQDIREVAHAFSIEHVTLEFENESESDDCMFRDSC
jgi:cobalt-zinc-cadmium efflux system protein